MRSKRLSVCARADASSRVRASEGRVMAEPGVADIDSPDASNRFAFVETETLVDESSSGLRREKAVFLVWERTDSRSGLEFQRLKFQQPEPRFVTRSAGLANGAVWFLAVSAIGEAAALGGELGESRLQFFPGNRTQPELA